MSDVLNLDDYRAGHSPTFQPAPAVESRPSPGSTATYVEARIHDALKAAHENVDWVYATQCVHGEYAAAVDDRLELVKAVMIKCADILKESRIQNKKGFL